MKYECANCGGEIKSLFHDPNNYDIRTNIGILVDTNEIVHLQCPKPQTETVEGWGGLT